MPLNLGFDSLHLHRDALRLLRLHLGWGELRDARVDCLQNEGAAGAVERR
jgi:hypothetical protein